jgi:hypothetical protein
MTSKNVVKEYCIKHKHRWEYTSAKWEEEEIHCCTKLIMKLFSGEKENHWAGSQMRKRLERRHKRKMKKSDNSSSETMTTTSTSESEATIKKKGKIKDVADVEAEVKKKSKGS